MLMSPERNTFRPCQEGLAGIFGVPERYIDSITFKCHGQPLDGVSMAVTSYAVGILPSLFRTFLSRLPLVGHGLVAEAAVYNGSASSRILGALNPRLPGTRKRVQPRMPLRIGKYNEKAGRGVLGRKRVVFRSAA